MSFDFACNLSSHLAQVHSLDVGVDVARAVVGKVASPTKSDDSVQVVESPQPLRFDSPPAIPLMEFQNQPGHIGSKPDIEKPMGKFLPSPGQSLFNKGR